MAEDTIKITDKFLFVILTPVMFFFFYILSFVEYMALIKSLVNIPKLNKSLTQSNSTWTPIERKGNLPLAINNGKNVSIAFDVD